MAIHARLPGLLFILLRLKAGLGGVDILQGAKALAVPVGQNTVHVSEVMSPLGIHRDLKGAGDNVQSVLVIVEPRGEFLLLCGLGAVTLLITLWLAVLAVKKFIPKYI